MFFTTTSGVTQENIRKLSARCPPWPIYFLTHRHTLTHTDRLTHHTHSHTLTHSHTHINTAYKSHQFTSAASNSLTREWNGMSACELPSWILLLRWSSAHLLQCYLNSCSLLPSLLAGWYDNFPGISNSACVCVCLAVTVWVYKCS